VRNKLYFSILCTWTSGLKRLTERLHCILSYFITKHFGTLQQEAPVTTPQNFARSEFRKRQTSEERGLLHAVDLHRDQIYSLRIQRNIWDEIGAMLHRRDVKKFDIIRESWNCWPGGSITRNPSSHPSCPHKPHSLKQRLTLRKKKKLNPYLCVLHGPESGSRLSDNYLTGVELFITEIVAQLLSEILQVS
jgi:hypothetical protein